MTSEGILDRLIESMSRADWWETYAPRVFATHLMTVKAELASLRAERDRLIGLLDARHVRLPMRGGEPMAWTMSAPVPDVAAADPNGRNPESDDPSWLLLNLLATIHGDGGHHAERHGWTESTRQAIEVVTSLGRISRPPASVPGEPPP